MAPKLTGGRPGHSPPAPALASRQDRAGQRHGQRARPTRATRCHALNDAAQQYGRGLAAAAPRELENVCVWFSRYFKFFDSICQRKQL
jgi:hypothetical protein